MSYETIEDEVKESKRNANGASRKDKRVVQVATMGREHNMLCRWA